MERNFLKNILITVKICLKYHLNNTLECLIIKYGVHLQFCDMKKIHKIFVEINRVLPQVNCNRKRIISLKYLLFRIFKMMNLEFENIQLLKSPKTLKSYKNVLKANHASMWRTNNCYFT